jgi:Domain of unknown function (DUF4338)
MIERTDLHFLGRQVSEEDVRMMQEIVVSCGGLTRMELARTVCELLEWKRRNRSLKARECREFLEKLEARGVLVLPEKRAGRPIGSRTSVPVTENGNAGAVIQGTAHDLGRLELDLVRSDEGRRLFRELVGRYHYLGHAVPFGAHLRYLVYAERPERRVVACVQFSSAAWRIRVRDEWIGWDDERRGRNLQHIVNNSRYLVLPWVEVKNLASRILSEAVRQMAADWKRRYRIEPLLAETLVDPRRYRGTCYRAANWIDLGLTSGLGRQDRRRTGEEVAPKTVLVYPLAEDAAERLRGN